MPAPANDNFANATVVSLPFGEVLNNSEATKEVGEPNPSYEAIHKTVWYSYTATFTGNLHIEATPHGTNDVVFAVYTGATLGTLVQIAADTDYDYAITVAVTIGTVYRIQVGSPSGWDSVGGILHVTAAQVGVVPPNDAFANRVVIASLNQSIAFDHGDATTEANEPIVAPRVYGIGSGTMYRTVWYEFTLAITTVVRITSYGWGSDYLNVYSGATLATIVSQQAIYGGVFQKTLSPGTYYVQIGTTFNADTARSIALTFSTATIQSNDQFVDATTITPIAGLNSISGNNFASTTQASEPLPTGYVAADSGSVWYKFEITQSMVIEGVMATISAMQFVVYRGTTLAGLIRIGVLSGTTENFFTLIPGIYYIQAISSTPPNQQPFTLLFRVDLVTNASTSSALPGTGTTDHLSRLWMQTTVVQPVGPYDVDQAPIEVSGALSTSLVDFFYTYTSIYLRVGDILANALNRSKFYAPGPWNTLAINAMKTGAPADDFVVTIYEDNAGSFGVVVGQTFVPAASLSTTIDTIVIVTPSSQQPEGTYWLVLSRVGTEDASNYFNYLAALKVGGNQYPYTLQQAASMLGAWSNIPNIYALLFDIMGPAIAITGASTSIGSARYVRLWSSARDGDARGSHYTGQSIGNLWNTRHLSDTTFAASTSEGHDFRNGLFYSFYGTPSSGAYVTVRNPTTRVRNGLQGATYYSVNLIGQNTTFYRGISVRNDGTAVLVFPKTASGSLFTPCVAVMSATGALGSVYSVWSGTTTIPVPTNSLRIVGVCRDSSDNTHIFFTDIVTQRLYHRVFTAANTFGSFDTAGWDNGLITANSKAPTRQWGTPIAYNDGVNEWVVFPYMTFFGSLWRAAFFPANSTATVPTTTSLISGSCWGHPLYQNNPSAVLAARNGVLYAFTSSPRTPYIMNVAKYESGVWSGYVEYKTGLLQPALAFANYVASQDKIGVFVEAGATNHIGGAQTEQRFFWFDPTTITWPATANCATVIAILMFINWIQEKV